MADYKTFCDEVLGYIPRATPREREEIRAELMAHLEDHRDLLLEHGADEGEAEEKSILSMGQAEEIGTAWNRQLSSVWLWIGRVCKVLFVLLLLCMISPAVWRISGVWDNLQARGEHPEYSQHAPKGYQQFWEQVTDIRQEFGEHVIRLHRVELGTISRSDSASTERQGYCLLVHLISYPKDPTHNALDSNIIMHVTVNGEERSGGGGGGGNPGSVIWTARAYMEKDTPTAVIELEHLGNRFCAEIPLEWGGAP